MNLLDKILEHCIKQSPVFVSVGHKISLESACKHILKLCTTYRLPETMRTADHLSRQTMKTHDMKL